MRTQSNIQLVQTISFARQIFPMASTDELRIRMNRVHQHFCETQKLLATFRLDLDEIRNACMEYGNYTSEDSANMCEFSCNDEASLLNPDLNEVSMHSTIAADAPFKPLVTQKEGGWDLELDLS